MPQPTFFETKRVETDFESSAISENLLGGELDVLANRLVARVVFPSGYGAVLDYFVSPDLEGVIESGMRVIVPLGRGDRLVAGYCIGVQPYHKIPHLKNKNLKSIQSILDNRRLLDNNMIRLAHWIADEYICPIGQVLEAMLPAGVRSNAGTSLTTVLYVSENAGKMISYLEKQSLVQKNSPLRISVQKLSGQRNAANKSTPHNINPEPILTIKQLHVLRTLQSSDQPLTSSELQFAAKCSSAPIDVLKRLGLILSKKIRREKFESASQDDAISKTEKPHKLNSDQINALVGIKRSVVRHQHKVFLLHGVTGSGKTEVYMQAIQAAVSFRQQAIVLVPEISLTPQTVGRFKSRFHNVTVLHSHLTDSERHHQWSIIASGKIQVVVGTRSAIFAPLPRLGLIVIDEEHESSFKQGTAPRYHARDVARKRAELENIPLILGSATPSMESWHIATSSQLPAQIGSESNKPASDKSIIVTNNHLPKSSSNQVEANNDSSCLCELISMPARVRGLELPRVEIVDLREEVRAKLTSGAIHRQLHGAINDAIKDNGQVILLLNRRGFSTHIQCPSCGEVVRCPNCDVSLTHHSTEGIALCHYCDYQISAPDCCKNCGFVGIRYQGFGTQKLEFEIRSRFPDVSVLRMDTDTMRGHGTHENALAQFREGKVQILLGTQMIAKGLDFPNVTLVGVINADTALHLPDFRAAERTFHLIMQVAGRTGRSERGGRVIVQTFTPDHPAIQSAATHNYTKFVQQELPIRKLLSYPPFTKMVRIVIRGQNERQTSDFSKQFAQRLKIVEESQMNLRDQLSLQKSNSDQQVTNNFDVDFKRCKILGPAPAPFARLRGFYRFHLHIYGDDKTKLLTVVRQTAESIKTPPQIQWIIDVDPIDML
ncbi:MAG: primosomal protein N' [Planctomycetaceae bacterium]|jgi:primosomal protein N' (replication factor Y)|nr:primosomal protein N' [Planctomycetaceae bacterium]